MKLNIGDWMAIAGALMISAGVAWFSPAGGVIVLGVLIITGGFIIDAARAKTEQLVKAEQARRGR